MMFLIVKFRTGAGRAGGGRFVDVVDVEHLAAGAQFVVAYRHVMPSHSLAWTFVDFGRRYREVRAAVLCWSTSSWPSSDIALRAAWLRSASGWTHLIARPFSRPVRPKWVGSGAVRLGVRRLRRGRTGCS